MSRMNLLQFKERFEAEHFTGSSVEVQIEAGWWDWFCKDSSLRNKTQVLAKKVISLMNSPLLNPSQQYVFFKNNCPLYGSLYDSFSICSIETGDVDYYIVPSSGMESTKGQSLVYSKDNSFKEPIIKGGWKDIKEYFQV